MSEAARALAAFLCERKAAPFVWGANDCATFAADWYVRIRGVDHAAAFRGRYDSGRGALRALRCEGHASVLTVFRAALGPPLPSPRLATRGDIAVFESDLGETAGIVVTGARIAAPGPSGLTFTPLARALLCWRV